jgi:enoyl-CoA hydratase/carnithine racemase
MNNTHYLNIKREGHVGVITFSRGPLNYFNVQVIEELVTVLQIFDNDDSCRATVFCAKGSVFCAGGEFGKGEAGSNTYIEMARRLYATAMKLFDIQKPIVMAIEGATVGGGLGLALVADFRVASKRAKFSANFNRLGIHPGFGSSVTLPRVVGSQAAELLFYTGKRIKADEASRIGLVDRLVEAGQAKSVAILLAHEIAGSAPLAVQSTRQTMRLGLAEKVKEANKRELEIQIKQMHSQDFIEGVTATAERRAPIFVSK